MKLKILCIILAITTLAACIWAVSAELRCLEYGRQAEMLASVNEPPLYSPDEPAAEFNGGVVTVAEASAAYEMLRPYYEMLGMTNEEAEGAKLDLLDSLIEEKILESKAREAGIFELTAQDRSEMEARVQAEYEDNLEYYMAFRFDESKSDREVREETIAYLEENGYSYADLLAQAEKEAWKDRLYDHVTADLSISDAELHAFYEEQLVSAEMIYSANYAEYEADCEAGRTILWHPDGVRRVQMLVVPFDLDQQATYSDIQAMLAAGDSSQLTKLDQLYREMEGDGRKLLDQLHTGADFAALFAEWGYGKPDGECIASDSSIFGDEIRDAAMALADIGDVSGLVRCDAGLCILRYAADVQAGAVSFEQISEELRANYAEELKMSRYNSTVMQWVSEANAKYYPEKF